MFFLSLPTCLYAQQDRHWELHPFVDYFDLIASATPHRALPDLKSEGHLYGVKLQRHVIGALSLEGAFAFNSRGHRTRIIIFKNLDDFFSIPISGGNTFLFDFGTNIPLSGFGGFSPFITATGGVAIRTAPLDVLFDELRQRVDFNSFPRPGFTSDVTEDLKDGYLAIGVGAKRFLGDKWGIRLEIRYRIERGPFIDLLVGPFFRF